MSLHCCLKRHEADERPELLPLLLGRRGPGSTAIELAPNALIIKDLYYLACTPINMGMRTIVHEIPNYLTHLIEALRATLCDANFLARHRVRPQDFTRERQLTFPVLMLFVLQQTVKSILRSW